MLGKCTKWQSEQCPQSKCVRQNPQKNGLIARCRRQVYTLTFHSDYTINAFLPSASWRSLWAPSRVRLPRIGCADFERGARRGRWRRNPVAGDDNSDDTIRGGMTSTQLPVFKFGIPASHDCVASHCRVRSIPSWEAVRMPRGDGQFVFRRRRQSINFNCGLQKTQLQLH